MLNVYGVGGSEIISRDMGDVLLSSNFKQSSMEGETMKSKELMSSDLHTYPHQHQLHQQKNSGLLRYRSAPSTFFANLIDGNSVEDFLNHPSSLSNEPETMFSGFMSCDGYGNSDSQNLNEINQKNSQLLVPTKQELDQSLPQQNGFSSSASPMMNYGTPVSSATTVGSYSMVMESNLFQSMSDNGNLIRQSSSPPEFFSGFSVTGDLRNYGSGNRINGDTSSSTCKLNNKMSFSSGPSSHSRFMPQIAEDENERSRTGSGFPNDSWDDYSSSFTSLKRNRDGDLKVFSGNGFESQFQQGSIPCKIRAKRGCATHPRSIAERMRRTRISERMKKLQDLFPNIDKQANTADMLDMAIEYIIDVQNQVQKLADTKAKCTCASKHH